MRFSFVVGLGFCVLTGVALGPSRANALAGVLGTDARARACFERAYDAAHLSHNPTQTVTRIRVSVSREPIPGSVGVPPKDFLRLELARRGDGEIRRAIAWCGERGKPAGIRCRVTGEDFMSAEEDDSSGHVDIAPARDGLTARVPSALRLRTGSRVSVDKGRIIRLGPADRTFRLTKIADDACEDLRQAIREE